MSDDRAQQCRNGDTSSSIGYNNRSTNNAINNGRRLSRISTSSEEGNVESRWSVSSSDEEDEEDLVNVGAYSPSNGPPLPRYEFVTSRTNSSTRRRADPLNSISVQYSVEDPEDPAPDYHSNPPSYHSGPNSNRNSRSFQNDDDMTIDTQTPSTHSGSSSSSSQTPRDQSSTRNGHTDTDQRLSDAGSNSDLGNGSIN
ncbi:uncharacterized protein L201_001721 [Kwoniella dendrophila CBS 6074]|uniref:Uncharacterized protein n=1 Tax=Kwoniella dendrophila CBS 6074 TaxID=1295534 RepID=A0AAX4JN56_9TREE